MKRLLCLLVLFWCPVLSLAQDSPSLELALKFKVVEIDKTKVITINYKEKVNVVESFEQPLKLKAEAGGIGYIWNYPSGVVAINKGPVLEITAALKGTHTVYVNYTFINFDKKEIVNKFSQVIFAVGDVPGPTPPIPPAPPNPPAPVPDAGLVASLKVLFRVVLVVEGKT